jgi:hypothetical protein
VRTGRETFWIFIIVFIPLVGCLVYLITQVLPDLQQSRGVRSAQRRIGEAIDPKKNLRQLRDQLELADNVDNRIALADECMRQKGTREARDLYRSCLQGPFETDPHLLLKLAQAEFELGEAQRCKQQLDTLIAANPNFQSTDGHLLYARALERMGDVDAALREYSALVDAYPGEEARIRYALLLKSNGKVEEAVEMFRQTLLRVKRAPDYYQRKEKRWISIARDNLAA